MGKLLNRPLEGFSHQLHILVRLLVLTQLTASYSIPTENGHQNTTWTSLAPRGNGDDPSQIKLTPSTFQPGNRQERLADGYLATCSVGGNPFGTLIDSGAWSFWLASPSLESELTDAKPYVVVDERKVCDQAPFDFRYGDRLAVKADAVQDTIAFAGVTVDEFVFGAGTSLQGGPLERGQSGLFGLSFNSDKAWLSKAMEKSSIAGFSADLGLQGQNELNFFTVGATPAGTTEDTKWVDLVPAEQRRYSSWTVASDDRGNVVFDTAASGVALTPGDYKAYLAKIGKDKVETYEKHFNIVKCGEALPQLDISFGGKEYHIQGSDLIFTVVADRPGWCFFDVNRFKTTIVGLRFLESYIVTFDAKEQRIGITDRA